MQGGPCQIPSSLFSDDLYSTWKDGILFYFKASKTYYLSHTN